MFPSPEHPWARALPQIANLFHPNSQFVISGINRRKPGATPALTFRKAGTNKPHLSEKKTIKTRNPKKRNKRKNNKTLFTLEPTSPESPTHTEDATLSP
jgi:hypothetical protein